jgi:hypothetical protein
MRLELLRERLDALDADAAYALVACAVHRAPAPGAADPLADAVHELLADTQQMAPAYARRAELYACAHAANDAIVMALLRTSAPSADLTHPESLLHVELRDVPLGRRRSLARRPDPVLLERLARDPDEIVIRNILQNPRTTEDEVVRMAAMRPVPASTLSEIQHSTRWSRHSRVRLALARNPYCPVDVALQQLHALPLPDLREVARDGSLHEAVRAHATHEIERRAAGSS